MPTPEPVPVSPEPVIPSESVTLDSPTPPETSATESPSTEPATTEETGETSGTPVAPVELLSEKLQKQDVVKVKAVLKDCGMDSQMVDRAYLMLQELVKPLDTE